ncbi:Cupin domain protein [Shewanella sp. P1-14-1]|uniref:cupin domain-containing protein n=1 Tax=Shewanella sp. P1-14-1 TaxID=1723761 RepID=UPI0006E55433|nr:cupin domain-containing protein [Shewanella sp. P1-14-1]KPZ72499.1 Cupin domain protein [Shewanella sp. P1-14-1]
MIYHFTAKKIPCLASALRSVMFLGVSLTFVSSFLSTAVAIEPTDDIAVEQLLKTSKSWDGRTLPSYPTGQPEVTILKITIAPGATLPYHQHPVINAGILTKGHLTVTTKAGKQLVMKAGDAIAEVVDKWHYGTNSGVEPVEIIVFYVGIEGKPLTIKQK